jgi:septum formation inhibitor MinC
MAADEAPGQQATTRRRRGRPPGSKSTTKTRRRLDGGELIQQLNGMIAELIKENRKLKRQVDKLTERGASAASNAVERSLRTIQRRVEKALTGTKKRKRRTTAAPAAKRRTTTTRRRRKAS